MTDDLALMADADAASLDAVPVLAVGRSRAVQLTVDGEYREISLDEARAAALKTPHLMDNRALVARRLGLNAIGNGAMKAYDLLELYAFTRPARFTLPTVMGLTDALNLDEPLTDDLEDRCDQCRRIAKTLLADLASETYAYFEGAVRVATFMGQGGWAWSALVLRALSNQRGREVAGRRRDRDGVAVWSLLDEWEERAPPPPPGDFSVAPEESLGRLNQLLGSKSEQREGQKRFAQSATYGFSSRVFDDGPNLQLLEAGTGTGKTLGYLAPASVWADKNEAPVWLATYTKALQRQLDQELNKLYPDPKVKEVETVVRKGRENYLCLLNLEDVSRAVMGRLGKVDNSDAVLLGLVSRWTRFTRDGDMVGGDFPSWLGGHFGRGRVMGLTDRRGECLYSACAHFRKCFIEKTVRKSKHARLVVANHALVIANAINRAEDPDLPKRLVFDEGHHLFDAADGAFAVVLSGLEGAELRRWIRGKETGGSTRARGLRSRLVDILGDGDPELDKALDAVLHAATILPGEGWQNRVSSAAAMSAFEEVLEAMRAHVLRVSADSHSGFAIEAPLDSPSDSLRTAAEALAPKLKSLAAPMLALAKGLAQMLVDEADTLEAGDKGRIDSLVRSLALRADQVSAWVSMLDGLSLGEAARDARFVEWFELDRSEGRERDIAFRRHWIDPSEPFGKGVLDNLHGAIITSATLRDSTASPGEQAAAESKKPPASTQDQPTNDAKTWLSADMRTGAQHLTIAPRRLSVSSPFDYPSATKILVVGDVNRDDPDQVAAAYGALFSASGGGGLGLFTAIHRLRAVADRLAGPFEDRGMPLYAQHVDPIDVATLVDMFRAEENSCLLGTDAVRDGVDVPGRSLRLIVFDRVPWPRPTLLHKARRAHFGGRDYDEMLTRLKLKQAYGRLVRRADDRGVFVMLDGRTPTRLLAALPDGVEIERIGLRDACDRVRSFVGPADLHAADPFGI